MELRVTADTELRDGPRRTAAEVAPVAAGSVVRVTGDRDRRWVPVRHDGQRGWVADRFLEPVTAPPPDPESGNGGAWTEERIVEAVRAAAREYGQPEVDMVRVARCESNLDPRAVNPAGPYFGLFQFLRGTWESTPFAAADIFDPVANANAAAWMWQQGRRGEWACQ